MKIKQYYLGCLAHASYMIIDEHTRTAAVVDPQRDVAQYLADAKDEGLAIKHVFLTHFHADFLAGHIELRDEVGAKIYLGAAAEADYDFAPVHDGDAIEFGEVRIEVMETPGHTPEGISLLVYDCAVNDEQPHAVLTGDTLFIGDVGRPDLLASVGVSAEELAELLYESIDKLRRLPSQTLVYPAHGAGSLCGKNLSDETVSTIGEQRRYNYALQPMAKDEFLAMVLAEQPDAPDYFVYDATRNRHERPNLDATRAAALKPLSFDELLQLRAEHDAQVLDVRKSVEFESLHLRGAIGIDLGGKFATWCGTLLSHDRPIVVIADPGQEEEAITRLGRIGFDNAAGYLQDGMQAIEHEPELLESTLRITAGDAADMLAERTDVALLDVRTEPERAAAGYIEGSLNVPLNQLPQRMGELPGDKQLIVHCAGGYRSAIACSLLLQQGVSCMDLIGGYQAWRSCMV